MSDLLTPVEQNILDFDMESIASGFADPAWVPQKISCIAWSWVGYDEVNSAISTQMGFFIPSIRRPMLEKFMEVFNQADVVRGHNLLRHDLPLLHTECFRLGLPAPKSILVEDTIRLGKHKGLKKGLDNLAGMLKTQEEKMAMDWAAWEEAYEDPTWQKVIDRCEGDVRLHKEVEAKLRERGWKPRRVRWTP